MKYVEAQSISWLTNFIKYVKAHHLLHDYLLL